MGLKPAAFAYRNQLVLYTSESLVRDSIGRTVASQRIPLFTPYNATSEPLLPAIITAIVAPLGSQTTEVVASPPSIVRSRAHCPSSTRRRMFE
jgi:hypothetical protein